MSKLLAPHGGGELRPLLVTGSEQKAGLERAEGLKIVPMSSRETSDLVMLAMGAYTPLEGFMGHADWHSVCLDMRLSDGLFWPIPITLSCEADLAAGFAVGEEVALVDNETCAVMGTLHVTEKYSIDKSLECASVFRAADEAHPGVAKVLTQGAINLAGQVTAFSEGIYPERYSDLYLRPEETRVLFESKGWSTVAAFQTRNPMHRSHEYLAKIAIEVCDGVMIHQVLGALKPGDIPAEVRVEAIDVLTEGYFRPDTVVQAGYPIEMRYAGPREALLHALFRQNFGCSHLVVGRDHAGVGTYYGPFDAQAIFDELPAGSLETRPLKIGITFYCFACQGMATSKTCPHSEADRLNISGTELRRMFAAGETIPVEFSRPEVIGVLRRFYDTQQG